LKEGPPRASLDLYVWPMDRPRYRQGRPPEGRGTSPDPSFKNLGGPP